MAELLLHSLAEFGEIVLGVLQLSGARSVVEVGSEYGTMTRLLAAHAAEREGSLVAVDPAPSAGARRLFDETPAAELIEKPSLEALGDLAADAYVVDGDHNYFTVIEESRLIWETTRRAGKPFLVFYHDVAWPWGRRDLYYDPERIPAGHRHPFTWDHGVVPGEPGVVEGGFRGEGGWACALREGGPQNGVLTAIEDFVPGKEEAAPVGGDPGGVRSRGAVRTERAVVRGGAGLPAPLSREPAPGPPGAEPARVLPPGDRVAGPEPCRTRCVRPSSTIGAGNSAARKRSTGSS